MKRILVLAAASVAAAITLATCSGGDAESLSIRIEVPTEAIRADGQTGAPIRATVVGAKTADGELVFTSDWPGSDFMVIDDPDFPPPGGSTTSLSLVNGSATAMLFSVRAGRATVQVAYDDYETGKKVSAVAAVTFGSPNAGGGTVATLEYLGAQPELVNLQGSNGSEQSLVRFLAKDSQGQPVANAQVTFILSQAVGGASIDPMNARTGPDGVVSTTLKAGTSPGTVTITAVSGTVQNQGRPITIAGGKVAGENFTFLCEHGSIGGWAEKGMGTEMKCTVFVGDQNKMYKEDTSITFLTEAGGVDTTVETSLYDPEGDGSGQGRAVMTYTTQCAAPRDVDPIAGEQSWPNCQFYNVCAEPPRFETRTCNPRDGQVTIVALTTGSEALTKDWNGNHIWDPADPAANPPRPADEYTDQSEPYVDANDNGQYDLGEAFYDFDGDQTWDPKNGKWDHTAAIWKTTTILWTGSPHPDRSQITPASGGIYEDSAVVNYLVKLRDINGNVPTAAGPGDVVTATCLYGCTEVKATTFYDDDALALGLSVQDANPCTPTDGGEPCTVDNFGVEFGYERTLDAQQVVQEVGTLGTRTGKFK